MNIKLVYLVAALDQLTFGLMIPVINPHLVSLGSSHFAIGLMNSATALVQFICNPLFGSISDSKGRKSTLLKTLVLGICSNFFLGLSYTSYLGVFIYRVLHAVSNQTMVLLKALVADNVQSDMQAAVYGNMGACMALGFILAPIISGTILETEGGFYNLSLLMTVLAATSLSVAMLLPDSTPTKENKSKGNEKPAKLNVAKMIYYELNKVLNNFRSLNWNVYRDLFLLKFMLEMSFHSFYSSFGLVLITQFSYSQKQVGYTLAVHAFLFVLFNPLYATVKSTFYKRDKTGVKRIQHAFFLLTITFIGFIVAGNWWIYTFFMIPFSAVRVLADTTFTEILVFITGDKDKGTVMGAFESLMSLSGLTTPLVMGLVTDIWGSYAPSFLALIPSIASIYFVNKMHKIAGKYTQ